MALGSPLPVRPRTAGFFYLLNTLTILAAIFCFRGIVVPSDPAATAANLLAHESLYRAGFALELISTACSVTVAALLYELLKPVDPGLSLLAALFRIVACSVAIVGYVFQLAPLLLVGSAGATGSNPNDVSALGILVFRLHSAISDIVIVYFGFHFVLLGLLIMKSSFLPRALGALALVGGLAALVFLVPAFSRVMLPYVAGIGLVVEQSLTWWLLIKGVDGKGLLPSRSTTP